MYVTRPLSLYRKHSFTISMPPPEAPSSGYLVTTDEESEAEDFFCWGLWKNKQVKELPFPQNKILTVVHSFETDDNRFVDRHKVLLIPVLDQPLYANRYYVIRTKGRYKGLACTCPREDAMATYCFCNFKKDSKPRALDHRNIYHQVKIHRHHDGFAAKSVAPDGVPPWFLRRKGWKVYSSSFHKFQLCEAQGLNMSLRMQLPPFDFSVSDERSVAVVVGKWYCPFVFIKEPATLKYQIKKSMFYEMTLEQRWEAIYASENDCNEGNAVVFDVSVQREVASVFGEEAMKEDRHGGVNGTFWFRPLNHKKVGLSVGLSLAVVQKMGWIQHKGGWIGGEEREVMVNRLEEYRGEGDWKRFVCYMLVESFVLRRMDKNRSLILTCEFRHTHRIQSKWDE